MGAADGGQGQGADQGAQSASWSWPRLPDEFHGSGCTLAAALSACLARGLAMGEAIDLAQRYTQQALSTSYAIAAGQRIPNRIAVFEAAG